MNIDKENRVKRKGFLDLFLIVWVYGSLGVSVKVFLVKGMGIRGKIF